MRNMGFAFGSELARHPSTPRSTNRRLNERKLNAGRQNVAQTKLAHTKNCRKERSCAGVGNPHISSCAVASKLCRLRSDTPRRPKAGPRAEAPAPAGSSDANVAANKNAH